MILLDEASLGLAPSTAQHVYDAIRRLQSETGIAMVVVEQNATLAFSVVDHALVLETGRVSHRGTDGRAHGHGRGPPRVPGRLTMAYTIQLIVEGFATGSIYGALALAIVLVNRATGLINFAQGGDGGARPPSSPTDSCSSERRCCSRCSSAFVFAFVLGAGVERFLVRRFEGGDPDTAVVVTIGLFVLIAGVAALIWGYEPRQFPSLFPPQSIEILGVFISLRSVGTIIVLVVVMVLLQVLFRFTKLGLAMRAVADNPQSAALSGLPVSRLLMVGWGLAAVLGAVAGVLVAPQLFISPRMLDFALVYALAAVILGGLDSPVGAVVAAWFIGIVENLAGAYIDFIGYDLKIAVPFIFMFIVLIVRPQGLFGRKVVVRI